MDLNTALLAIWAFLPAGVANMTPLVINKIPIINKWWTPLDFGKKYRGIRILGNNKTWRGLTFGALMGGIAGLMQFIVLPDFSLIDYSSASIAFMSGLLLGLGALLGDAVESFFKRQKKLEPGKSWFPFDQIDYIIGALALWAPLARPSWGAVLAIVVFYFGMHLLVSYLGYLTGFKKDPL